MMMLRISMMMMRLIPMTLAVPKAKERTRRKEMVSQPAVTTSEPEVSSAT